MKNQIKSESRISNLIRKMNETGRENGKDWILFNWEIEKGFGQVAKSLSISEGKFTHHFHIMKTGGLLYDRSFWKDSDGHRIGSSSFRYESMAWRLIQSIEDQEPKPLQDQAFDLILKLKSALFEADFSDLEASGLLAEIESIGSQIEAKR